MSLPDSTIDRWNNWVRIYAPDGTKVSENYAVPGSSWYIEAAQAGTYRIVVDPAGEFAGTATVRVKDITDQ
ncbi:hypothetical protein [Nocardioides sp. InS609-2]|uniref:hypothetical protein n=1 Tax=Nocardioides sp. InS609-2 TaxID=2760705 RepID=UPI0020BFAD3E|nr:hypothetical protein [Nocardioides sp. InS609-2]